MFKGYGMTDTDRRTLLCTAQLQVYPDSAFFAGMRAQRANIEKEVQGFANPVLHVFLDELEALGIEAAQMAHAQAREIVRSGLQQDPALRCLDGICELNQEKGIFWQEQFYATMHQDAEPDSSVFLQNLLNVPGWGLASVVAQKALGALLSGLGQRLEEKDNAYALLHALVQDILSREYPALICRGLVKPGVKQRASAQDCIVVRKPVLFQKRGAL